MASTAERDQRIAAITGAGGGLGRELALKLAKGYRVFATTRSPDQIKELDKASGGAVTATVCDITDEPAIRDWVGQVADAFGDRGLDVLISNAGILTPGPLEVPPRDAIRREFEVNVLAAWPSSMPFCLGCEWPGAESS